MGSNTVRRPAALVGGGSREDPQSFVAFASGRVFISTALGCRSGCLYCYTDDFGYGATVVTPKFGGSELRDFLLANPGFAPGPRGDVLSFGCFGEPFDPACIHSTLDFVSSVAVLGNPIQVATKRRVSHQTAGALAAAALRPRQLVAFISMSSVKQWRRLEPGTASPNDRTRGALGLTKQGVPVCLYIQPVVPGVTDRELDGLSSMLRTGPFECGVLGTLHATPRIRQRLRRAGLLVMDALPAKVSARLRRFPVAGVDNLREIMPRSALAPFAKALSCAARKPVFLTSTRMVQRAEAPEPREA